MNGTSIHEPPANDVDPEIQSFERSYPKQNEVIGLREDDDVRSRNAARVHDGITDVSLDLSTVRQYQSLATLRLDPQRVQHPARDPRKLTSCVHHRVGELLNLTALRGVLDPDSRPENSHFRQITPPKPVSPYHYAAIGVFAMPKRYWDSTGEGKRPSRTNRKS